MTRWTEDDLKRFQDKRTLDQIGRDNGLTPKKSRYRSEPVIVDGVRYASKKQYQRWCQLQMLERAGKIADLRREVPFELAPAVILDGRKKSALRYFADATYIDGETLKLVCEDTKSPITRKDPVYRIKKHLMATVRGIEILET